MSLALVVASACAISCSDRAPTEPARASKKAAPEQDATRGDEARARQNAFGLPLPPRVLSIERHDRQVRVKTDMTMRQLELFYQGALKDYEVIVTSNALKAYALRPNMPWVRAIRQYGPRRPIDVTYLQPMRLENSGASDQPSADVAAHDKRGERADTSRDTRSTEERYRHGAPVTRRDAKGNLIAPGARWGVPYTPPPGSPLHKKKYEHNFGRPYGEWFAH